MWHCTLNRYDVTTSTSTNTQQSIDEPEFVYSEYHQRPSVVRAICLPDAIL